MLEDTGSEADGEGLFGSHDRVADSQAGGVFVTLDGSTVAIQLDDFTDELLPTDLDEFIHLGSHHLVGNDERTSHFEHTAEVAFALGKFFHGCFLFLFFLRFLTH